MTLGQVRTALGSTSFRSTTALQMLGGMDSAPTRSFSTACEAWNQIFEAANATYANLNSGNAGIVQVIQREWNWAFFQSNCSQRPYPNQTDVNNSASFARDLAAIQTAITVALGMSASSATPINQGGNIIIDDPANPMGAGGSGSDPSNPDQSPTPLAIPEEQAEEWTQVAGTTAPSRVLQLAMAQRSQNVNVGALVIPVQARSCLLYTSPSPRDRTRSRMPSSA